MKKIDVKVKMRAKESLSTKDNILDSVIDVPIVNVKDLTIDDNLYTIESTPVVNQVEVKKSGKVIPKTGVTDLMFFGVKSHVIDAISKTNVDGEPGRMFNGEVALKLNDSSSRKRIEESYFTSEEVANAVMIAANEIESEKVYAMMEEMEGAIKLYEKANEIVDDGYTNREINAVKEVIEDQKDRGDDDELMDDDEPNTVKVTARMRKRR